MNSTVANIKLILQKNGILFREQNDSIFLTLPNGFGELQIMDLEGGDDLIGLVGSDWHTHSDCLGSPDMEKSEKIMSFYSDIMSGKYLLIEEVEPEKEPKKTIEDDLKKYIKYLPKGTKYKIYNKT
ncbi:hypothetical protein NBRC116493_35960 [Aurantivibrio infirmus]